MKTHLRLAFATAVALAMIPATASGQSTTATGPLVRADVAGTLGWLSGNKSDLSTESYNDWYNDGFYGSGIVGWYWTDHHKTEVEIGASRSGQFYAYESFSSPSLPTYRVSRYRFSQTRLGITQRYQFGHNAFFHPYVGAGIDLTRETTRVTSDAAMAYDPVTRQTVVVEPAHAIGPSTHLAARVAGEVGFKAYVSQRAFFRSDLRLTGRSRLDDVLLRFGFGIDF